MALEWYVHVGVFLFHALKCLFFFPAPMKGNTTTILELIWHRKLGTDCQSCVAGLKKYTFFIFVLKVIQKKLPVETNCNWFYFKVTSAYACQWKQSQLKHKASVSSVFFFYEPHCWQKTNVASIHVIECDLTQICLITISDKTEYDVLSATVAPCMQWLKIIQTAHKETDAVSIN